MQNYINVLFLSHIKFSSSPLLRTLLKGHKWFHRLSLWKTGGAPELDADIWFFDVSCGFSLIEQAPYRTANQIDHGDEVGLIPVAACA